MDVSVGYLMNIRNEERMRIQIGIDRNGRWSLRKRPEIAQPRPAWPDNVERKTVLMPKSPAVRGRCRREMSIKNVSQNK